MRAVVAGSASPFRRAVVAGGAAVVVVALSGAASAPPQPVAGLAIVQVFWRKGEAAGGDPARLIAAVAQAISAAAEPPAMTWVLVDA